MKTFNQHLIESDTPLQGRKFVKNKITITFHPDRVEHHYGEKLLNTKKGDYSKPTNRHLWTATAVANNLIQKHRIR